MATFNNQSPTVLSYSEVHSEFSLFSQKPNQRTTKKAGEKHFQTRCAVPQIASGTGHSWGRA
jgi:hypothetical protein